MRCVPAKWPNSFGVGWGGYMDHGSGCESCVLVFVCVCVLTVVLRSAVVIQKK